MRITNLGHATLRVECAGLSLLIDPWLTHRLDRFWEHYPDLSEVALSSRTDIVLMSHHHYDHFHLPSLARLNRDTILLFPATQATRAVTSPGGGAFAIPWLSRRLGFQRIKGLQPFECLNLGKVQIVCLPSDVQFPELSFLISDGRSHVFLAGDSMLHPDTRRWFELNDICPDLSILPVHSTANDACFQDRSAVDDTETKRTEAINTFREYIQGVRHKAVIPGAFGWRVATPDGADEPKCDWMNQRIFPITIAEGYDIALGMGVDTHLWAPGDSVQVETDHLSGEGARWDDVNYCRSVCEYYKVTDRTFPLPAFEPEKIGPPASPIECEEITCFVEQTIPEAIRSTPYYMQAIERGSRTRLRITGQRDRCWIANYSSGTCDISRSDADDFDSSVWIAESTFLRLIRAEIPIGHTWGCWVATSPLLDAVFSDPRYFCSYADKLLKSPQGIAGYGF